MQSRERQEREDIEEQMDALNREAEEVKREN
jgi:chromosome segregation ATPase